MKIMNAELVRDSDFELSVQILLFYRGFVKVSVKYSIVRG